MGRLVDVVVAQRRHGRYSEGNSTWYGSWEDTRTIKINRDKLTTSVISLSQTRYGESGIAGLQINRTYDWTSDSDHRNTPTTYRLFKGSSYNDGDRSEDSSVNSLPLPENPEDCRYSQSNRCGVGSASAWAAQQAAYSLFTNTQTLTEDQIIQFANPIGTSSFNVVIYDTEQLALATYNEVRATGQYSINSDLNDTSQRFKLICIVEEKFTADKTPPSIAIQFKTSTTTLSGSTTEDASDITTQVNLAETNTFKSAWITVERDGTTILNQDALPVIAELPAPLYFEYLVSYTDERNHFDIPGEYTVTVFAEDWSGNSRTETETLEVIGPPMTCNTWTGNSGIPADLIVGVTSTKVDSYNHMNTHPDWMRGTIVLESGEDPSTYSSTDWVEVLRAALYHIDNAHQAPFDPKYAFIEYQKHSDGSNYLYYHAFPQYSSTAIDVISNQIEADVETKLDRAANNSLTQKVITYGFCNPHAKAEEGDSWSADIPLPSWISTDPNCQYDYTVGVTNSFLNGRASNLVSSDSFTFEADKMYGTFEVSNSTDLFNVVQDVIAKSNGEFLSKNYRYITLIHPAANSVIWGIRATVKLADLWTTAFPNDPAATYTVFGYCDNSTNVSTGNNAATPIPPPTAPSGTGTFGSVGLGTRDQTKSLDGVIEGYFLGNATVVTPELVINRNWNRTSMKDAMCVDTTNFYNYLGHYIAPSEALSEGPFENDLTRSSDNSEVSSPGPLSFGSIEPEETDRRVMKIVASSRAKGDIARATDKNTHYDLKEQPNPSGSSFEASGGSGEPAFSGKDSNGTGVRGVPAVVWGLNELLESYDVDSEDSIIQCMNSDTQYNKDLHQDFSAFTEYVWGNDTSKLYRKSGDVADDIRSDNWGDPTERFQTGVELEIVVKANNDRGRSDAGVGFGNLNRRSTNDTKSWAKIWIGDKDDLSETTVTSDPNFPVLHEFLNPHFSTGRVGFGNGDKSTRTFHVRVNRKPHEDALRIYVQGYISGNRRGELSPKGFIDSTGQIFGFEDLFDQWLPGWLNIDVTIPPTDFGIKVGIKDAFVSIGKQIDNTLNTLFGNIFDIFNRGINLIMNTVFGFLFALMRESYAETYHSKLEIEVREVKVYDSKFEDEDIERHPATKYFDGMNDPLAYPYTQFHYPFVDANRFRVFGKKYYHSLPFMKNEVKTGNPQSSSRVLTKNRYFVANLFRLTYETNIGVFYEYLLRQTNKTSGEKDFNYNTKLEGHQDHEDSNSPILKQKKSVYDLMMPSNDDSFKDLIENGLEEITCFSGLNDAVGFPGAEDSKIENKSTNKITDSDYSDIYSKYGITGGSIDNITKIIGKFDDIADILDEDDGYLLSKWTEKVREDYVGLGSTTPPRNLSYKIMEFILWYLQPNGIAQETRLAASSLFEYEKISEQDIDAYDHTVTMPTSPPLIINGDVYERQCPES